MKVYGKEINEKRVVENILFTLTQKYDSIVASTETSLGPSSLSMNNLVVSSKCTKQDLTIKLIQIQLKIHSNQSF